MDIEILISRQCRSCAKAVAQWKLLCDEQNVALSVCDAEDEHGRALMSRFNLKVLPAVIVDGELRAVGVQTPAEVRSLLLESRQTTKPER